MPLQATSGAASYDAFGGGVPAAPPTYIEDVFSTWLYVGNTPSTNTINNGIDLAGKGGLVWIKERNAGQHSAWDTVRGVKNLLIPNQTAANLNIPVAYPAFSNYGLQSFNSNGFTLGRNWEGENAGSSNIVSWTFREQPKFFDIVTYTGDGGANRAIPHNLGSTPGCFIVKRTDTGGTWAVWHRSLGDDFYLALESTQQAYPSSILVRSATSTTFSVGSDATVNASGGTYVCYLFAHDAGGFGLTGTDNVISCGTFTTDGSGGATINLGYEPQWFLYRKVDGAGGDWELADVMRKFTVGSGNSNMLYPNSSSAEAANQNAFSPTSTGVTTPTNPFESSVQFIYIAIRRGPMKVPTVGTSVFSPTSITGNDSTARTITMGINPDLFIFKRTSLLDPAAWTDKLRGNRAQLTSTSTAAEVVQSVATVALNSFQNTGVSIGAQPQDINVNYSPLTYGLYGFTRAPSFFDEVCYTGTGSVRTVTHNLGAVPEMMIVKSRSSGQQWSVYTSGVGPTGRMPLQLGNAADYAVVYWNDTAPTSSVFTVGSNATVNQSSATYVAYLFATCVGENAF